MSAFESRLCGVSCARASASANASPIEAPAVRFRPPSAKPWANAPRARSIASAISALRAASASSRPNSSPPQARERRGRAEFGGEARRDLLQQRVARKEAQRVVHGFEAVDADARDRERPAGLALRQGLVDPLEEQRARRKAGQRVAQVVGGNAAFGFEPVAPVADRHDMQGGLRFAAARDAQLDGEAAPVDRVRIGHEAADRDAAAPTLGECRHQARRVRIVERSAIGREQVARRPVGENDRAALVDDKHGVRHRIDQCERVGGDRERCGAYVHAAFIGRDRFR
jgi:hypothetical protein